MNKVTFKFEKDGYILHLYPDQKALSSFLRKNFENLSGKDMRFIYKICERDRVRFESSKKNNRINNRADFLLWVVLFIVIIFTAISNNSNFSFIFSGILFSISILFSVYVFSKRNNEFDNQREQDKYNIILEINKNIGDLINLMKHNHEKGKTD